MKGTRRREFLLLRTPGTGAREGSRAVGRRCWGDLAPDPKGCLGFGYPKGLRSQRLPGLWIFQRSQILKAAQALGIPMAPGPKGNLDFGFSDGPRSQRQLELWIFQWSQILKTAWVLGIPKVSDPQGSLSFGFSTLKPL